MSFFDDYQLIADSGLFDGDYYRRVHAAQLPPDLDPLTHYLEEGARLGLRPSEAFDVDLYMRRCAERGERPQNPLLHFLKSSRIHCVVEQPPGAEELVSSEDVVVSGWAVADAGVDRVEVLVDGRSVPGVSTRIAREDVMAAFGGREDALRSGFDVRLWRRDLSVRAHRVEVRILDRAGGVASRSFVLRIVEATRGAPTAIARSTRHVLVLESGCELEGDAISELVATLDADKKIGLVGAKLVRPDGTLVPKGDADEPQHNYRRRVDSCGAAVLIRRSLWKQLGGLDGKLASRELVLADFALRARKLGFDCVYQPLAVAIDRSGKRRSAPKSAPRTRERRAIFIDATTPTPDHDAGSNVAIAHMRILQSLGFQVTFAPSDNLSFAGPYTQALQRVGIEAIYQPYFGSLDEFLKLRGHEFDVAYVHRYTVGEMAIPLLRRHAPRASIWFNNADLHYLRLEREAAVGASPALAQAAARVKQRELDVIRAADRTILCSSVELDVLRKELPDARLEYLPWVIEARPPPKREFGRRRGIMFLGGFGHRPNVDAVRWFVAEVMPLLRKKSKGVRLHVYGSRIPGEIASLATTDIVIEGFAEDLDEVFERHRLSVAPLRFGAGFKGKIAESLARGVPVVASAIAVEGSGLTPDRDVLVADDPEALADAIARLYRSRELWSRMSRAGRRHVAAAYSFERGRAFFAHLLEKKSGLPHKSGTPLTMRSRLRRPG